MGIHESVLDGRNRLRACELAGVEPLTCVRDDIASPTTFVLSLNLHRRHLTPAQRAALGVDVSESFAAEAAERHRQASAKGGSAERKAGTDSVPASTAPERDPDARALTQAAKAVGAGREATERMAAVQRDAPEVFAAVKSGAITTVTDAKTVAALPEEQRTEVLQRVEAGETVKAALPHVAHNSGQNEWYTPAPWIGRSGGSPRSRRGEASQFKPAPSGARAAWALSARVRPRTAPPVSGVSAPCVAVQPPATPPTWPAPPLRSGHGPPVSADPSRDRRAYGTARPP